MRSIRSIISFCSSISSIEFSGFSSKSLLISSSLCTFAVISGNVVSISSATVLSLDSRNKSCERNQIFVSFKISISPRSASSGLRSILRKVDFPAPFFPTSAILSSGLILSSASSKRIVEPSCLQRPLMVMR